MADTIIFIFSLLDCCFLIFLAVYFVIAFSDLECDFLNVTACCSRLNKVVVFLAVGICGVLKKKPALGRKICQVICGDRMWVLPELVAHTGVTVLMLITMHWLVFLLNVPLAAWNLCKYFSIPSGNVGLYDPTEIHNRGKLKFCMKEAMAKLGYHLLLFFIYLYSMIFAMVSD